MKDKIPPKLSTFIWESNQQTNGSIRTKKFGNPKEIKENNSIMKINKGFGNDKLNKTRRNESIYTTWNLK